MCNVFLIEAVLEWYLKMWLDATQQCIEYATKTKTTTRFIGCVRFFLVIGYDHIIKVDKILSINVPKFIDNL